MGLGDQLMATGMACGAAARGRRIAFGDGRRIIWDKNSATVFENNPNIAPPGAERDPDLEWIGYYKGNRGYNRQEGGRWIWNLDFHAIPGEMFFTDRERKAGGRFGNGFVVIEPAVERWKRSAQNKEWGRANYQAVADSLIRDELQVVQFVHPSNPEPLEGVKQIQAHGFRDALAILSRACLYIGPEGGLHHGAAAVDVPAVVLFGGFIPPSVTGYATHTNLTGGAKACGSIHPCLHCKEAMRAIHPSDVLNAARSRVAWWT